MTNELSSIKNLFVFEPQFQCLVLSLNKFEFEKDEVVLYQFVTNDEGLFPILWSC